MNNNSQVSVIIPVFNCEKYLAEAVESALAQTYRPLEVILVDDGSTDGSADIARHFATSVQYDFGNHEGPGATRNRGVNLARGSFLAFLDGDDLWVENKLACQMTVFNKNPELDMTFGYVRQFHSPELDESRKATIDGDGEIMTGPHAGTMLIKRESFFRAGHFDTNWRVGEFIDWYIKAIEAGLRSFTLPEVVMKRRLHGDNMVIRERKSQTDYVRILKASLDRRRKKGMNE